MALLVPVLIIFGIAALVGISIACFALAKAIPSNPVQHQKNLAEKRMREEMELRARLEAEQAQK